MIKPLLRELRTSKMQNYGSIVNDTLNSWFTSNVVPAAEEETGKAQLTRAAAWEIYKVDSNIGLMRKESGNNVNGLSVDALVDKVTGEWADIATAQGVGSPTVTIKGQWLQHAGSGSAPNNWVQPTLELAKTPGPMPTSSGPSPEPPQPGPGPDIDTNKEIMDALNVIINTQLVHTDKMNQLEVQAAGNMARMNEHDDNNTEKIQRQLHQIVEDAEATLKQVMIILIANRTGSTPMRMDEIDRAFQQAKKRPKKS
jgi:hypothetical protein